MQLLHFELPKHFSKEYLKKEVTALLKKNELDKTIARVRINIVRGNGGLFDAENHHPHFIIECTALPAKYEININGLQLGIYPDAQKTCDSFSHCKHNNFLPYTMGALFAKENKFNDAIVLNQYGRISDSCIANIFIIKNEEIYTPSLEEGCIAGIVRAAFVKNLANIGYKVHETAVSINNLLYADEIFLTNSVSPLKWVSSLQDSNYGNKEILNIYNRLPQILPEYFQ